MRDWSSDVCSSDLSDFPESVRAPFDLMRQAWSESPVSTAKERKQSLTGLLKWVQANEKRVAVAIDADFGGRSHHETRLAEVMIVVNGIKHTRSHLEEWMAPQRREVWWMLEPAQGAVQRQPLGVVGVMAPWNYPFQLAVLPLVQALAAGNRVLIKPSELTPQTSDLLAEMCAACFPPDQVSVITGGPEIGAAFSSLPFDHLFFTGSTQVGRLVMQAAAKNLTPVTLELGGKSPVLIHDSYPLEKAAGRIATGKWLNAGQTCVAPDYVLLPKGKEQAFADAILAQAEKMYPTLGDDYTAIVSERHHKRQLALLEDARAKGATVIQKGESKGRKIPPTVVLNVSDEMTLMQEEIFGPILPIEVYEELDQAIARINSRPRPLALYYFDHRGKRAESVLQRTVSGGAVINDVVLHLANEELPFGGVGHSGIGSYHGLEGFQTFSHEKAVFYQSRFALNGLFKPPYGSFINFVLDRLI